MPHGPSQKNAYYAYYNDADVCVRILREFGLEGPHCHIINGHVPVKTKEGENPVKAGGRLIVIDGGFCRAYQPTTGIAGYTLIYNSWGIRLASHEPFDGRLDAIRNTGILYPHQSYLNGCSRVSKLGRQISGAQLSRNSRGPQVADFWPINGRDQGGSRRVGVRFLFRADA